MPTNKKQPNAFYYFMLDWKKQEEKTGRRFINGLKDVQNDPAFNEAWRNLSKIEKSVYKEKEKENKLKQNMDKKTSLGESLQEVLQIQMKEKAFNDRMKEHISRIVKEAKASNSLNHLKFYAIHVNYYCVYEGDIQFRYCPAEIGLVEFSLEEGVTRLYSKIIYSEIRKGYAYDAREHSNNTHQIPKEPEFGEKNYSQIFKEICEFVKSDNVNGKIRPLFTVFNQEIVKNSVVSVLDLLASFSKEDDINNFVVYSFEELFVNLYNINLNERYVPVDEMIASMYLKKDPFDYKKSLCCEYHKLGMGENFCSTSIVQRWIFILFSNVCSLFEIKVIPGHHEPIENSLTQEERELNESLSAFNIHEDAGAARVQSTDWNAGNSNKSASERTYRDEEIRRAQSKPLSIIYHGSFQGGSTNSPIFSAKQPVLSPRECPQSDRSAEINMSENNFPSIGRGAAIRNYIKQNKSEKVGYASCFK